MNKKAVLTTILIVLILAASGFVFYKVYEKNSASVNVVETQNTNSSANFEEFGITVAPDSARAFSITEGSVSYIADKQFFNEPDELVTGTTEKVSGVGWFEPNTKTVSVGVRVDLSNLSTNSSSRDIAVQRLISNKIATLIIENQQLDINLEEPTFRTQVNTELTINGITKGVDFDVNGSIESRALSGNANVKMSEFGVTPPSVLEVYEVKDEMEITFEVKLEEVE